MKTCRREWFIQAKSGNCRSYLEAEGFKTCDPTKVQGAPKDGGFGLFKVPYKIISELFQAETKKRREKFASTGFLAYCEFFVYTRKDPGEPLGYAFACLKEYLDKNYQTLKEHQCEKKLALIHGKKNHARDFSSRFSSLSSPPDKEDERMNRETEEARRKKREEEQCKRYLFAIEVIIDSTKQVLVRELYSHGLSFLAERFSLGVDSRETTVIPASIAISMMNRKALGEPGLNFSIYRRPNPNATFDVFYSSLRGIKWREKSADILPFS